MSDQRVRRQLIALALILEEEWLAALVHKSFAVDDDLWWTGSASKPWIGKEIVHHLFCYGDDIASLNANPGRWAAIPQVKVND